MNDRSAPGKVPALLAAGLLLVLGLFLFLLPWSSPTPAGAAGAGPEGAASRPSALEGKAPPLEGDESGRNAPGRRALPGGAAGRCAVAGRVFSMEGGAPLPGVEVLVYREFPATRGLQDLVGNLFRTGLWRGRIRPALPEPLGKGGTDPEGRFRIEGLPAGRVWLTLGEGFYYPYRVPGVELRPGETREGVEIAALEGGLLRGRVVDWRGKPVKGALLDLRPGLNSFLSHFFGKGYHWRSARSDEKGEFVLQGVPPGREYVLTCFGPGFPIQVLTDLEARRGRVLEVTLRGKRPASVAGVVKDAQGRPLPGARAAVALLDLHALFFSPQACPPVTTGPDGSFRIGNLPPGPAALAARMEGKGLADPEEVTLREGEDLTGLVLTVGEGAVLTGIVTDLEGRPLEGALVEGWNGDFRGFLEMSRLLTFGRTRCRTGKDGTFRLAGLFGGRCFLRVSREGYAEAFLPRLKIGPARVEVRLKPLAGVRGIVLAKDASRPVTRFTVSLAGVPFFRSARYRWDVEDPKGKFFLPAVPAGEQTLRFRAFGFVPAEKKVKVEPGGGARGVIVLLERESLVTGRVVDSRGNPVAGARVAAYRGNAPPWGTAFRGPGPGGGGGGGRITVSFGGPGGMRPRRGRPPEVNPLSLLMGVSGPGGTFSGPDGSFTIRGLRAGTWRVAADHPDYAPSEAVQVETSPGTPASDVVLRMREGAVLWGFVTDLEGKPVPHAVVAAFSLRYGLKSDTTDRNGRYRIAHLLPGKWFVFKSRVFGHRTRNIAADLLGNLRLRSVRIPREGKVRLDITDVVEGGVEVRGRVLRGGRPVPHAVVTALTGQGEGPLGIGLRSTMADGKGLYRLPSLQPGSYVFQVAPGRGRPSTIPVEVPQGVRILRKDLFLPTTRITGIVLDPSGAPVKGARVRAVPKESLGGGGLLSLMISRGAWRGRTDGKGVFALKRVPAGSYDLQAEPPRDRKDLGETVLEGIQADGRSDLEGIRLILPPAGILEGTVRDGRGEPVPGALVRASREGGRRKEAGPAGKILALRDLSRFRVETGPSGTFRIEGAPAGRWSLRAEKEGYAPAEAKGLVLPKGGLVRADLVLRKGGTVKVQVVNETGSPLPSARIRVLDEAGREVTRPLSAAALLKRLLGGGGGKDREGWYVLENVKPGAYTVVVEKPGGKTLRRPVQVREGEVTEFRLVLK